jgi:hypothetical protein
MSISSEQSEQYTSGDNIKDDQSHITSEMLAHIAFGLKVDWIKSIPKVSGLVWIRRNETGFSTNFYSYKNDVLPTFDDHYSAGRIMEQMRFMNPETQILAVIDSEVEGDEYIVTLQERDREAVRRKAFPEEGQSSM